MRRAGNVAAAQGFPGALYDGDGTLLAGDGPEMTPFYRVAPPSLVIETW